MNKWEWIEELDTWVCTSCDFRISDIQDGLLDDESLDPVEYGFVHCPNCGELLEG